MLELNGKSGRQEKMDKLARDVLVLSRNTLLVNLRFLDAALSQFTLLPAPGILATDGERIFYDAPGVLNAYRAEKEQPVRDYLHMVLHCVFRHNLLLSTLVDQDCWDLACDVAVESIIQELNLSCTLSRRQNRQANLLAKLKSEVKQLTAEKLYRYFQDQHMTPRQLRELREQVCADDHRIWYLPPEQAAELTGWSAGEGAGGGRETENGGKNSEGEGEGTSSGSWNGAGDAFSKSALSQRWKDIAERMQTDLETFSKQRGDQAGSLIQNLQAVNREKYDYTSFLKKFAVLGEAMKVNDDEFDYIFYTYGMKLFGNMPLIEPLEYKEVKRIREFVVAIDTSGSVSGNLVQKFIQKTYNILKQEESFFSKINLHIIQCDAEIQEDAKITSQEEFDRYLKTMQLRGFGGTDFRPVFSYVEELRRAKEFRNLKGLIYFTDGFGVFPKKKPDYPAAFVFVNDQYEIPDVPPWAIKLVLEPEEI